MTIKYKSHKDLKNNIISFTKWNDDKFVMAIPMDEANTDYQTYLEWKAIDGNEPEAAD